MNVLLVENVKSRMVEHNGLYLFGTSIEPAAAVQAPTSTYNLPSVSIFPYLEETLVGTESIEPRAFLGLDLFAKTARWEESVRAPARGGSASDSLSTLSLADKGSKRF